MPNNDTPIGEAEDQKKTTFFSLAMIPEGMSVKTAGILIDSVWLNSDKVAEKYGVSGGRVRNIICDNRDLFNKLVDNKKIVLAGFAENGLSQGLQLVVKGLETMEAPKTPSQLMALVQAMATLKGIKEGLEADDDTNDNTKKIEKGVTAAQKLLANQQNQVKP